MQVKIPEIIITKETFHSKSILDIATIKIPEGRKLRGSLDGMKESISTLGLLNPITVSHDNVLIAGYHRLMACKELGWERIEAQIFREDDITNELITLAENIIKLDLTVLQRSEDLKRYNELLIAKGWRANQSNKGFSDKQETTTAIISVVPDKEVKENPVKTTSDLAKEIGVSERTIYQEIQIARDIDDSVKDIIRGTKIADSKTELLQIAREKNPEIQKDIVDKIINKPHVSNGTGDNEWYTAVEYIESARKVLGGIDLDPASCQLANTVVKASEFYTIETNGLNQEWHGKIWMNPPYSVKDNPQFIDKLVTEYNAGHIESAIILVNNATETKWFVNLISIASMVCFPTGRLKFWSEKEKGSVPLQGQAIVYIGNDIDLFVDEFSQYGWMAKMLITSRINAGACVET
jgi:ParB family chromosome partitioning protein